MLSDFECMGVKIQYVFDRWRVKWIKENKKQEGDKKKKYDEDYRDQDDKKVSIIPRISRDEEKGKFFI